MTPRKPSRSLALCLLLLGATLATGCAAATEEETAGASDGAAITRDEVVAEYLVRNFPSTSPKESGVDAWDLAVVDNKKNVQQYLVLIALSTRSGSRKPLFELIIEDGHGEETKRLQVRSADAEGAARSLSKERLSAVQKDIDKMQADIKDWRVCQGMSLTERVVAHKKLAIASLASFASILGTGAVCAVAGVTPAAPVAWPLCYTAVTAGWVSGVAMATGVALCIE